MKRFLMFFLSICMIMGAVPMSLAYAATDLTADSVLDSYAIRADATFTDSGSFTIKGNCSDGGKNFYSFTVDLSAGLTLSKTENGVQTLLESVSVADTYIDGVSVIPNAKYTAILQNHKGSIECFVNGTPVISYIDKAPLSAGTSAVEASEGTTLAKTVVGAADFVTTLTIVDKDSNTVESVDVPVGNVPEIKALTLKADYADGTSENIPLDRVKISEVDTDTVGEKTATVTYKQAKVDLVYNIVNRTELVEDIVERIEAIDISTITINDKTEIQKVSELYNTLSGIEKATMSANTVKKLEDALDKLEIVICPELKGSKIVFKDTFDSSDSDNNYESHVSVTGDRHSGYWYTENGRMLQYSVFDEYRSGSFAAKAILKDKNFEIRSVAADVMVIDPNVFLGIDACLGDGKFFEFYITDKTNVGGGNRIQLFKNSTMIANTVETDNTKWFAPYTWYNLRITLDNGKVRCYVDDVLRLEADDIPESPTDTLLTTGTVAMRCTEGWGMFDNLIGRGTELPTNDNKISAPKLTPGYYIDHF
ncbi:MAG: bacterial Ig-like domain-containing protein, partial [Clostridia bacterium]|nr:bacterial Ig-like domain-containing protein [Clostridia bacterium]